MWNFVDKNKFLKSNVSKKPLSKILNMLFQHSSQVNEVDLIDLTVRRSLEQVYWNAGKADLIWGSFSKVGFNGKFVFTKFFASFFMVKLSMLCSLKVESAKNFSVWNKNYVGE